MPRRLTAMIVKKVEQKCRAGDEAQEEQMVGSTHSVTKNSWKRQSFVSSGWKVVRRCRPCLSATTVRGSVGSVSSSSSGPTDAGRREEEMREMTSIGGSDGPGVNARTTCRDCCESTCGRKGDMSTHWCADKDPMEWPFCFPESLDLQWRLERLDLCMSE